MNDFLKLAMERRSIRKYTNEKLSDEQVKDLLTAGMYAPSGGNAQPWDFVVIDDRDILDKVIEFHPYAQACKNATMAIMVCGNLKKEKFKDLWIQDCSAATLNIHMAAHAMGLGSVWMGLYPEQERVEGLRALIGAPEHVIPFSIISIGYPDESRPVPERYKEDMVHTNKW